MKQRNKKKFTYNKSDEEELGVLNQLIDDRHMIDYIKLRSARSNETFMLFLTLSELMEIEIKIQRMFVEKCSLAHITSDGELIYDYCEAILDLKKTYADALDIIGYQPPEIAELFDGVMESYSQNDTIEDSIESAYAIGEDLDSYRIGRTQLPGSIVFSDTCKKVLYSMEAFVKVLRDNL